MDNRGKNADKNRKSKNKKGITFDEKNLAETYHPQGKDYGFMKINEPQTPRPRVESPINAKDLRKRLEQLREVQLASSVSVLPDEAAQRARSFEERRKVIYSGEFDKAKAARQKTNDPPLERGMTQQSLNRQLPPKIAPSQSKRSERK